MPALSPPPVPARLREMLKDYPGHIERLQEALNVLVNEPSAGIDPFERAVWLLEGRLETFAQEAGNELTHAESSGDSRAIDKAKAKQSLMMSAGFKSRWITDQALEDYIHVHRDDLA